VSTEQAHFEELSHAKIIGLTGGIASGKSTISAYFGALGVSIIDADLISREIVAQGEPALESIVAQFGKDLLLKDGELNREKLGEIIFSDEVAREALNAILHPQIGATFMKRREQLSQEGNRWLIYDAALIVENNLQDLCEGLIVVSCDPDIQKARLMDRNNLSSIEAQKRLDSQFQLSKKVALADWIIDNSGSLAASQKQVDKLFRELCLLFGKPKAKNEYD